MRENVSIFESDIMLGVNIDHIATLRNARGEGFPSPLYAAQCAYEAGAHSIVCHLREDRRHIKDEDLFNIKRNILCPLNMEMALRDDIIKISFDVKPSKVTIVPERRDEITTEGGLDVEKSYPILKDLVKEYKKNNIEVFLFIEAEKNNIDKSVSLEVDGVEIHTGKYANLIGVEKEKEFLKIKEIASYAHNLGLKVAAGHGLNYQNVIKIASIKEIFELNIGFSIISHSIFVGFEKAIKEMLYLMRIAKNIKNN
ncbi:MAG: pyridoxine 5'-phosphate synthase [Spirochaetes bacterium]|nr:pyridoxine 5'-phosphate synthase [Spirochaetota bacterium]